MSMNPIERTNLAFTAGAVAVSLAVATPLFAASLAAGALIEAVNFRGLRRSAELLFFGHRAAPEARPPSRLGAAGFGARFALLAAAIGTSIYAGAHPVGLVIGLSLIMPAAVIEAWRTRPPVDPEAQDLAADDDEWDRWNPWLARERSEDAEGDEA